MDQVYSDLLKLQEDYLLHLERYKRTKKLLMKKFSVTQVNNISIFLFYQNQVPAILIFRLLHLRIILNLKLCVI